MLSATASGGTGGSCSETFNFDELGELTGKDGGSYIAQYRPGGQGGGAVVSGREEE